MELIVKISNEELKYIQEYAAFYRNPFPCLNCHRTDDVSSCKGCDEKKKWDSGKKKLESSHKGVDKSIVTDHMVQEYINALNAVHMAGLDAEKADLRLTSAKARLDEALAKFTIVDDEEES